MKKKPNTARVTSLVLAWWVLIASNFGTTRPHAHQYLAGKLLVVGCGITADTRCPKVRRVSSERHFAAKNSTIFENCDFVCVSLAYPLLRSAVSCAGTRLYSHSFGENVILWDEGMHSSLHHYLSPSSPAPTNNSTLPIKNQHTQ